MIRVAQPEDFETVKSFVPKLIRDSDYGKFFAGYELTQFMYDQYTENPLQKLCIIIGDDVGFAMFDLMVWPYIDHTVKFSRLPFIYIEPEFRKGTLMDEVLVAFEHWSKLVGANYCTVGTKQPKKNGYKKTEVVYLKEIK